MCKALPGCFSCIPDGPTQWLCHGKAGVIHLISLGDTQALSPILLPWLGIQPYLTHLLPFHSSSPEILVTLHFLLSIKCHSHQPLSSLCTFFRPGVSLSLLFVWRIPLHIKTTSCFYQVLQRVTLSSRPLLGVLYFSL